MSSVIWTQNSTSGIRNYINIAINTSTKFSFRKALFGVNFLQTRIFLSFLFICNISTSHNGISPDPNNSWIKTSLIVIPINYRLDCLSDDPVFPEVKSCTPCQINCTKCFSVCQQNYYVMKLFQSMNPWYYSCLYHYYAFMKKIYDLFKKTGNVSNLEHLCLH